eukprot:scaffold6638_cov127-Cylindrotheca_fusiformis.AAC.32
MCCQWFDGIKESRCVLNPSDPVDWTILTPAIKVLAQKDLDAWSCRRRILFDLVANPNLPPRSMAFNNQQHQPRRPHNSMQWVQHSRLLPPDHFYKVHIRV